MVAVKGVLTVQKSSQRSLQGWKINDLQQLGLNGISGLKDYSNALRRCVRGMIKLYYHRELPIARSVGIGRHLFSQPHQRLGRCP